MSRALTQPEHPVRGTAALVNGTAGTGWAVAPTGAAGREVLRDFTAAVAEGHPMPIPLEEGLRAVAVAAACYRSAREGRSVAVEDIAA